MKNKIKILSLIFSIAIYCVVSIAIGNTLSQANFIHHHSSSQEEISADFSVKLFCPPTQSESSFTPCKESAASNSKHPFSGFLAQAKANEQLLKSENTQYACFARNLLINQRKSDLIFPFQYFW